MEQILERRSEYTFDQNIEYFRYFRYSFLVKLYELIYGLPHPQYAFDKLDRTALAFLISHTLENQAHDRRSETT